MPDHKRTGFPDCGPTKSSAPETCYPKYFLKKIDVR